LDELSSYKGKDKLITMRKALLLGSFVLILQACYKDIDRSITAEVERPTTVIVDADIHLDQISDGGNSMAANAALINGTSYQINTDSGLIEDVKNLNQRGQFIELFVDNTRVGAFQTTIIENQVNNLQATTLSPFKLEELSEEWSDTDEFALEIITPSFTDQSGLDYQGRVYSERNFSTEDSFNDGLITYAINKEGRRVVVDVSASFFLGFQDETGRDLSITSGELELNVGVDMAELYWFSKDERLWIHASDIVSGQNTSKLKSDGWFAIGTSHSAVYHRGNLELENTAIAKQALTVTSPHVNRTIFTSSAGGYAFFYESEEETKLEFFTKSQVLLSHELKSASDSESELEIPSNFKDLHYLRGDFEVINCVGGMEDKKALTIQDLSGKQRSFVIPRNEVAWLPVDGDEFTLISGAGPELLWKREKGAIHYLTNCPDFKDGFSFLKIRDNTKVYPAFNANREMQKSILSSASNEVKFIVEASAKGSYEEEYINVGINDPSFGEQGYFVSCENAADGCGIDVCEISYFKEDGDEWNRIFFSGEIWMQTIDPPQAGNFEVEGYIISKK